MKETFGSLLWSSFRQIYGPIVSVLSVFFAMLFWVFLPITSTPLIYLVIIGLITFIIILTLGQATYTSFKTSQKELPRVINSKTDQKTGNIICVLEPSILFSQGIAVTFYYVSDDEFEIRIGIGQVILIQRNGKIQVLLDRPISGQEAILEGLGNNNDIIKNRIYIKPSMNIDMLLG